jgi:hypothetical protein
MTVESAITHLNKMGVKVLSQKVIDESQHLSSRPPFKFEEIKSDRFFFRDFPLSIKLDFFNNRLEGMTILNEGETNKSLEEEFGKPSKCEARECWQWESKYLKEEMVIWDRIYS